MRNQQPNIMQTNINVMSVLRISYSNYTFHKYKMDFTSNISMITRTAYINIARNSRSECLSYLPELILKDHYHNFVKPSTNK